MTRFSKTVALAVGCAGLAALIMLAWPRVTLLADSEVPAAVDPAIAFYGVNSVNELFPRAR